MPHIWINCYCKIRLNYGTFSSESNFSNIGTFSTPNSNYLTSQILTHFLPQILTSPILEHFHVNEDNYATFGTISIVQLHLIMMPYWEQWGPIMVHIWNHFRCIFKGVVWPFKKHCYKWCLRTFEKCIGFGPSKTLAFFYVDSWDSQS